MTINQNCKGPITTMTIYSIFTYVKSEENIKGIATISGLETLGIHFPVLIVFKSVDAALGVSNCFPRYNPFFPYTKRRKPLSNLSLFSFLSSTSSEHYTEDPQCHMRCDEPSAFPSYSTFKN